VNRDTARLTLELVFQEVFDDDALKITENMAREDLPGWDSLGHIRLISATEEAFATSFTIEEIEGMTSVGRILDMVSAKS